MLRDSGEFFSPWVFVRLKIANMAPPSGNNDDSDDVYENGLNSMTMPSPALSGSDDDSDGLRDSVGIRNWQNGTPFGNPPDRSGSPLKWDFSRRIEQEDAVMSSGLPSPIRGGSASPAAVDIRVDEVDVANVASGVDTSTASHMDELE